MIIKKYPYLKLNRIHSQGKRFYCLPDGSQVASVTTILDATKSEESKAALKSWRLRIGPNQARDITTEAASRGTRMHSYIEHFIKHDHLKTPGSHPLAQQSNKMAELIIEQYLKPNVTEYWGSEISLCYPGLYAGTTDVTALWNNKPTIIDFKQANKPKKTQWITDYFIQLAAYAVAHDYHYNTVIEQGVILMCSQDFQPQFWVISGDELQHYKNLWFDRVTQFYSAGERPL